MMISRRNHPQSSLCKGEIVTSKRINNEYLLLGVCVAALLVAAFARWPYFIYVLLRVLICTAAAYLSTKRYQERRTPWVWTFGAIALLFNPVFPVRMTRSDWQVVNILAAVFLAGWAAYSMTQTAKTVPK
ncbi:MAG TPA: DUF6804 family protein [Terracidiphilus sp.]|jgi:hypothetical protein